MDNLQIYLVPHYNKFGLFCSNRNNFSMYFVRNRLNGHYFIDIQQNQAFYPNRLCSKLFKKILYMYLFYGFGASENYRLYVGSVAISWYEKEFFLSTQ